MIKTEALSFSYGQHRVLSELSLTLEPGRVYAVIGPNGSGKSTLLRCLAGLLRPAGRVTLDGRDCRELSRREMARLLSLLPQEKGIPGFCVEELVACGRYPHTGASREENAQIVRSAIARVGLAEKSDRRMETLSGGQRQLAYLAMTLAQNTPYLLLDEPTTHLDIQASHRMLSLLREEADRGKCVVAVLHALSEAFAYADEVLLLSEGRSVDCGAPDAVASGVALSRVFGVNGHRLVTPTGEAAYVFLPKE